MIFNVVVTGSTFWHLRYFVFSLIDQSDADLRIVANGCSHESLMQIEEFARTHRDRIVEVFDASPTMVAHGVALDAVRRQRNDGDLFCFADPDIKARSPFLHDFLAVLNRNDAVTSGKEVWTENNVLVAGASGVGGRHFYDSHGFTFGSPHFAMYRSAPLEDTLSRWGVGLGSAGPELSDAARVRMAEAGHRYRIYDTGKVANILFQLDGHTLVHQESSELLHIGGLSHFISPGDPGGRGGEEVTPAWGRFGGMEARLEVARYTAAVLRASIERRECPSIPTGLDSELEARLELVRVEMTDLVERYRGC